MTTSRIETPKVIKDDLFLITAATGNTGTPTVEILRAGGRRVRALVHKRDARSRYLEDLGAEVVEGDLQDFRAVSSAMVGVTAAYFCYPISPGGLPQATALFAQAASKAGVHAVVNMSQMSARREAGSNAAQQHWIAERLLDRTALVTTHLRPTFFLEWINWTWVRRDTEGILRLPFGDGRHGPIGGRDQAKVIAAILQNPDSHDHQIYPLFGAEELDYYAIAVESAARTGNTRAVRTDRDPPIRCIPDRQGRNPIHRATSQQRGAGLPRRYLRRNEQPRRSDRREQADDRRGVRHFNPVKIRHRRQILSPGRVAPDRLTSELRRPSSGRTITVPTRTVPTRLHAVTDSPAPLDLPRGHIGRRCTSQLCTRKVSSMNTVGAPRRRRVLVLGLPVQPLPKM